MNSLKKYLFLLLLLTPLISNAQNVLMEGKDSLEIKHLLQKITLDLDQIDAIGLIGPPDGKRQVAYEFCIPVEKKKCKEVRKIDRSVQFQLGPAGRSGCSGQYLCIGSGGTKAIILRLARLEYIKQINPCYWE